MPRPVSEPVMIRLTRPTHLTRPTGYFVQCDQLECQYVETNAPPCPLHVGMFAEDDPDGRGDAGGAARQGY